MKLENICPNNPITARLTESLKTLCKKAFGALGLIFFSLKKVVDSAVEKKITISHFADSQVLHCSLR